MPRDHSAVRADAAAGKVLDTTPTSGNLVRVQKPEFLSLVDHPANQTGFKVVRSDTTKKEAMPSPVIRRTRRSEAAPVLCLTFPENTSEAEVNQCLTEFGMTGYTVEQTGSTFRARRSDLQSIAKEGVMDIKLNDAGVIATVARSETPVEPKSAITMAAIEFDSSKFDETKATEWLTRNSIDSKIEEPQNPDSALVVRRSAVSENEETRRLELEAGVTAVLVRSDTYDIPDGYVAVINECAYGSWGWGHLDFTATMADVAFSEQMRDGVNHLEEILRNILYYSSLPLDVRKTLMNNALTQFGTYIGTLMDSLPRQLLASVVRSASPQQENSMTTKANEGGANTTAPAATTVAPTVPATNEAPLTRADVAALVAEGVATALAAANLTRSEPAATTAAAPAATAAAPAATAAAPAADAPLSRADLTAAFVDAIKPLAERMTALEGTTVVRAAPDARVTVAPAATAAAEAGKTENVFRGAIPGIGGRSQAQ